MIACSQLQIEGRALAGSKSHYTDSHHKLHKLVQTTTHSHLTGMKISHWVLRVCIVL